MLFLKRSLVLQKLFLFHIKHIMAFGTLLAKNLVIPLPLSLATMVVADDLSEKSTANKKEQ